MNCRRRSLCALVTLAAMLIASTSPTVAGSLASADISDPAPRAAFVQVVEAFQAEQPNTEVRLITVGLTALKSQWVTF